MVQGVEIEREERDEICSEIVAAMVEGYGNTFSGSIQKVNRVSRAEAYRWMDEDSNFKDAVNAARRVSSENLLDLCESRAAKKIDEGDRKTILFYLERKGKHRGYAARTEHTGDAGKDLNGAKDALPKIDGQEELDAISELLQAPRE